VLPHDPNHPEVSFTRGHVSIGMIDGLLYLLKCDWEGCGIGAGLQGSPFILSDVKVWVFENNAWRVFINNVRMHTNLRCPQLLQSPKKEESYILYPQNTNQMVVYEGVGVPLKRYNLSSRRGRRYTAVQHTPSFLPLIESLALNEIVTDRYLSLHYKL